MHKQFDNVLKELIISHKEFFETKLALILIKDPSCIHAIVKISNNLISMLKEYYDEIVNIIEDHPKFTGALYNQEIHGHLTPLADVAPLQQALQVLGNADENPSEALHVQTCFIHYIYDYLNTAKTNAALKQELVQKIFNPQLFSDRARTEISTPDNSFYQQGICRLEFFNQKITSISKHKPAKEKFIADVNSSFYAQASKLLMPTISGPSGHTGSLMLLAGLLNLLNKNEWQDYALVIASYLVIAGAHSFHESLMVSKTVGVEYKYGNYNSMFANKLKSTQVKNLLQQYDHYLERSEEGTCLVSK